MMKSFLTISLIVGFHFNSLIVIGQQGGWAQKANHGGGNREGAIGFSIGTMGYFAFGNTGGSVRNSLWEYNPATNAWTQKANGSARQYAVAIVINNKAYVGTGEDVFFTRDKKWNEYDPATNTWTAKADFGGTARSEAIAFAIGTKGYVGTGFDGARKKDFWEFDATANTWTQKADFGGTARRGAAAFAIGAKGYVGTGDDGVKKKDFWEYDPIANTWAQRADFGGTARTEAVGFSMNNKGYIATGDNGVGTKDIWEYDPLLNTWISKAQLPGQRRYIAAAFAISNKGYVGTGFTDEPSVGVNISDFWEFEAVKTSLAPSNVLVTAYSEKTIRLRWKDNSNDETGFSIHRSLNNVDFTQIATVAANVRTYLDESLSAGQTYYYYVKALNGDGASAASNTASQLTGKYETGVWTRMSDAPPSLRIGSKVQSFTIGDRIFLPMVILSQTSTIVITNQTWMYDAALDTWTQKADFPGTPRDRPVSFAYDGKGYVGMGRTNAPTTYPNDFWMYDPAANGWTQKNNFAGASRLGAFSFVIGTRAYVGSGNNGSNLTDFWEYNPATDSWISRANLPSGASGFVGFAIGSTGYAGLGTFGNQLYAYNTSSNTWTSKASFPNGVDVIEPSAIAMSNGKVFVTFDDNVAAYQMWEYQVANDRWIELPKSPYNRNGRGPFAGIANAAFQGVSSFGGDWYRYTPDVSILPPSDFKAEIIDAQKIQLSWVNQAINPSNSVIKLYRATTINGTYTMLTTLVGSSSSHVDNFNSANAVFYKIQVENAQGTSGLAGPAPVFKQGMWKKGKQLSIPTISNGVAVAISGKGYFGVGTSSVSTDATNKAWWEYDPATDAWTQKALFPGVARLLASAFSADNKGYIGLGQAISGSTALNDFWEYNASSNTWTQKANFAGSARYEASATGIGTKGYVFAGLLDQDNYFQDTWEYNALTDTWSAMAPMPGLPQRGTFAVPTENGILVGGGGVRTGSFGFTSSLANYLFDPSANMWVKKGSLPVSYSFSLPAFSLGGTAYVYLFNNGSPRLFEYNITTQQWISRLEAPGNSTRGFSIGNRGYIIDNNMTVWRFNPDVFLAGPTDLVSQLAGNKITLTWTDQSADEGKFVIELNDGGRSYVFAKEVPANTTSAELTSLNESTNYIYRVRAATTTDEWSQSSNAVAENTGPYWGKQTDSNTPYLFGATAMTIQNKIYYGLGLVSPNVFTKDFWSFDPATNAWTQQADFPGEGRSMAPAFSFSDKGYVLMGLTNTSALSDFWKYNATNNTWTLMPSFTGSIGVRPFATVQGNFAYVGMDSRGGLYSKEIWRFDMSSEAWMKLTDFPEAGRSNAFALSTVDRLLIGGGSTGIGGAPLTIWELNLTSGTWVTKKNLPDFMTNNIAALSGNFTHDGIGYVFTNTAFRRYYFATDRWDRDPTRASSATDVKISHQQGQNFAFAIVRDDEAGPMVWRVTLASTRLVLMEARVVPFSSVRIKWLKPTSNADSVIILRSTNFTGIRTKAGHITSTDTTFIDSGLTPGTTYFYSVSQVNKAGRSASSNSISVFVPEVPPAPVLQASLDGSNVVLQWTTALTGPDFNFVIEKSVADDTKFVALDTITQLTFTDNGVAEGRAFYRVFAYNAGGISPKSNVVPILYLGVEEDIEGINTFPSPTSGKIFIEVDEKYGLYSARVFTLSGNRILEKGNSPSELDLTSQTNGLYVLVLINSEGTPLQVKKIIKE